MNSISKEKAREKFRKTCGIKDIHSLRDQDTNYEYKKIDVSTYEGLARVDRYIDAGWEVVYSKEKGKDDRSTAAQQDGKEDDLRMSPVSFTTKSGHTMIQMRCLKTQREKNELQKKLIRDTQFAARQKLKKQGNNLSIQGDEVNLNNLSEEN